MGKRDLDRLLRDLIIEDGCESVTLVGHGDRANLIRDVQGILSEVDLVDYDPKFDNPRDAVFDDIDFKELVVVFNAEKHFPIGQLTSRRMIVVGDNDQHNGDCNPISSCEMLIEQNNMVDVEFQQVFEKWFIVKGTTWKLNTQRC